MVDENHPERERSIEIDPSWHLITRVDVLYILDQLSASTAHAQAVHSIGNEIAASLRGRWEIDG